MTIQTSPLTVTPSGQGEKCHCNQMALYCVNVTSVTVSEEVCNTSVKIACKVIGFGHWVYKRDLKAQKVYLWPLQAGSTE